MCETDGGNADLCCRTHGRGRMCFPNPDNLAALFPPDPKRRRQHGNTQPDHQPVNPSIARKEGVRSMLQQKCG